MGKREGKHSKKHSKMLAWMLLVAMIFQQTCMSTLATEGVNTLTAEVGEVAGVFAEQDSPAEQPETSAPQPETPAPQPETEAPQPETPAPQPETPAPQPETPAPQPETEAPQPETSAPQPETEVPQPESLTEQPETEETAQMQESQTEGISGDAETSEEQNSETLEGMETLTEEDVTEEMLDVEEAEVDKVGEEGEPKEYSLTGTYSDWVQAGGYLHIEGMDGTMRNIGDFGSEKSIPTYAKFEIRVDFHTSADLEIQANDKITYELPDWIYSLNHTSGFVSGGSAAEAGTWTVENNKVVIQYKDAFLENNNKNLSGYFILNGDIKAEPDTENGGYKPVAIRFGEISIQFNVVERDTGVANIDIQKKLIEEKKRTDDFSEIEKAVYEIRVKAGSYASGAQKNEVNLKNVVITDVFTTGEKISRPDAEYTENDSLKQYITYRNIKCGNNKGQTRTVNASSKGEGSYEFALVGELEPDEELIITYDAVIDPEMYQSNPRGPAEGGPGSGAGDNEIDMSWEMRAADNMAAVTTDTIKDDDGNPAQKTAKADRSLIFDKVWLWKGVTVHSNYKFSYELSVNENPMMEINGWTLTDDLKTYGQEIISDIRVTVNGADYETIALESLKNGTVSGAAAESTTEKLVYVTSQAANYRFYFDTKMDPAYAANPGTEKTNRAVLTDNKGHVYGVNRTIAPQAATITKQFVRADVTDGALYWQTTVDEGVDIKEGDIYNDYVGWEKSDESDRLVSRPNTADQKDHHFDLSKIGVRITAGENQELIPGDAYTVKEMPLADVKEGKDDGFRITFHRDIAGPVIITYRSEADFVSVPKAEMFTNDAQLVRGNESYEHWATYTYACDGTINETALEFEGANPTIRWQIEVNSAQYETAALVVKNRIPVGLEFDESKDIEIREASHKKDGNLTDAYKENAGEQYYKASYNKDTRELEIRFNDIASTKVVFWIKTTPALEILKENEKYRFNNTAELWSAGTPGTKIGQSSAHAVAAYKFADKQGSYDEGTAPDAVYTIQVNPGGMTLNEGKMLTLKDEMGHNMLFKPDTLAVKRSDNGEVLTAGTDYTLAPDQDNEGFTLKIPDAVPLTVTYKVYIPGKAGEKADISNRAVLSGEKMTFAEVGGENQTITIAKSQSGVTGPNRFIIEKTDKDQYSKKLKGAEFDVYEYTGGNPGNLVGTVVTGDDGTVITPEKWILETGTPYCFKETKAPEGYLLDDTVHVFVFIDDDTNTEPFERDQRIVMINVGQQLTFTIVDEPIELIDIPVEKVWDDNENQDGKRKSVTVRLYQDSKDTGKTITLDSSTESAKNWKGAFTDLPKTTENKNVTIAYTIKEDKVEDYTSKVTGDIKGYTVINTHTPEKTSVSVGIKWEDADNQDGIRPDSVTVTIKNGTKTVTSREITKDNNWTCTFENLDKYENEGKLIQYTVEEEMVDKYEKPVITGDLTKGYTITNIHIPEVVDVPVSKIWEDHDNQAGARPDDITVKLLADGADAKKTLELNKANQWKASFEKLEKYRDQGTEIKYTVEEIPVKGYTAKSEAEDAGWKITNKAITVNVNKVDASTKAELEGAVIGLYAADTAGRPTGEMLDSWTSKKNEIYNFGTKLEAGKSYVLVETKAPEGYAYADPVVFTVKEDGAIDTAAEKDDAGTILIEDAATVAAAGQIRVTKEVVLAGFDGSLYAENGVFYAALFKDAQGISRASDVKEIRVSNGAAGEVIFDHLLDGTYYVFETTADGQAIPYDAQQSDANGRVFTVTARNNKKSIEIRAEEGMTDGEAGLVNTYSDLPDGFALGGELSIQKLVVKDGKQVQVNDTFYATVFKEDGTVFATVKLEQNGIVTIPVPLGGKGGKEAVTYTIKETDANGNVVGADFFYEATLENEQIKFSQTALNNTAVITNTVPIEKGSEEESEEESEKKEKTAKTETTKKQDTNKKAVKTGDNTPLSGYLLLLIISGVAVAVLSVRKRRKAK